MVTGDVVAARLNPEVDGYHLRRPLLAAMVRRYGGFWFVGRSGRADRGRTTSATEMLAAYLLQIGAALLERDAGAWENTF